MKKSILPLTICLISCSLFILFSCSTLDHSEVDIVADVKEKDIDPLPEEDASESSDQVSSSQEIHHNSLSVNLTVASIEVIPAQDFEDSLSPVEVEETGFSAEKDEELPSSVKTALMGHGYHILIDPGHGGNDSGAIAGHIMEKDLNGKISQYLAEELGSHGFLVSFSRDPLNSSITLPLNERVEIINKIESDLVISIHHNANPNSNPHGFSVFWSSYRPWLDQEDIWVRRGGVLYPWIREEIRNNITYVYYKQGDQQVEITGDDAYSIQDKSPVGVASESLQLAELIHDNLLKLDYISPQNFNGQFRAVVDMENRVLRLNRQIAVLVECGFMTNPREIKELVKEENQRAAAKAIAQSILEFFSQK